MKAYIHQAMRRVGINCDMAGNAWTYADRRVSEQFQMDGHLPVPTRPQRRVRGFFAAPRRGADAEAAHAAPDVEMADQPAAADAVDAADAEEDEALADDVLDGADGGNNEDGLDGIITRLKQLLKKTYRMKNYWHRQTVKARQERDQLQKDKREASFEKQTRGSKKADRKYGQYSLKGGYRLAVKRGVGHASALSVLLSLGLSKSDHSVWPWERLLGANLVSQAKSWFSGHYDSISKLWNSTRPGDARAGTPLLPN